MQYLELLPEIRENEIISRFDGLSLMIYQHVFDRKPIQRSNHPLIVQACHYGIKFVTFCIEYYQLPTVLILEAEARAGNFDLFALHCDPTYFGKLSLRIYTAAADSQCLPILKFLMANDYHLKHTSPTWDYCYLRAGETAAIETIEWLRSCHPEGEESAMIGAAEAQNLPLLKRLHETGIGSDKFVFAAALIKENIEILKWHHEIGGKFPANHDYAYHDVDEDRCDSYMMFLGLVSNQEIIEWILSLLRNGEIGPDLGWNITDLYKGAAHGGNLGLMIWLRANYPAQMPCDHTRMFSPFYSRCWFQASCDRGDLLMLEWLFGHHPASINPCCYLGAAISGRVDILDYLVSRGVSLPPPADVTDRTIDDYRSHYAGYNVANDHNMMRWAAHCNQPEVIQWFLDHGVLYRPVIAEIAVHAGSLECLQWIIDNVKDAGISGNSLMKIAAKARQFDVLQWLTERGYSKDGVLLSMLREHRNSCIIAYYRYMLIWMVEHDFPLLLSELLESRDDIMLRGEYFSMMGYLQFIAGKCARASYPQIHDALMALHEMQTDLGKLNHERYLHPKLDD